MSMQVATTGTVQPQVNPFAAARAQHINAGTVAIEAERAIAEAQGKLVIAKRFPRDQAGAFEKVMISCKRPNLAQQAMYSYPKGGQVISGPSIRLAEELARAWGNLDFGIRELSQRDGVSEMEAYCWDLETNVMSSQKFTVKHERHTNQGVKALTDPRDIYELTANQAGRRLRARILAVLPPDLVEAAVEECRKTLAGNNSEPLQDRIRKMLKAFTAFGVTKAHIENRIGKPVDSLLSDELVDLITIYNSLKDNMSKPSDWFGIVGETPVEQGDDVKAANEKLKKAAAKKASGNAPSVAPNANAAPGAGNNTQNAEPAPDPATGGETQDDNEDLV